MAAVRPEDEALHAARVRGCRVFVRISKYPDALLRAHGVAGVSQVSACVAMVLCRLHYTFTPVFSGSTFCSTYCGRRFQTFCLGVFSCEEAPWGATYSSSEYTWRVQSGSLLFERITVKPST